MQEKFQKLMDDIDEVLETNDFNLTGFTNNYSVVNLVECKSDLMHAQKNIMRIAAKEGFTLSTK